MGPILDAEPGPLRTPTLPLPRCALTNHQVRLGSLQEVVGAGAEAQLQLPAASSGPGAQAGLDGNPLLFLKGGGGRGGRSKAAGE